LSNFRGNVVRAKQIERIVDSLGEEIKYDRETLGVIFIFKF